MVSQRKGDAATVTLEGTLGTSEMKGDYRESIKKLIETSIKSALDDEMRKAAQELMEEQKKAVKQILEEQKTILRQVVEEEKKAIWTRAEELRKSIIKLGL